MDTVTLTWEQLFDVLDDFREWYEFEWLGEHEPDDLNAIDYFIQIRRKDPCWPDRQPQEF